VDFIDIDSALPTEDNEAEFYLPPHQRCLSHTLSLIATTDVKSSNFKGEFKKVYTSAFAKCFGLWNLISRSTKAADVVEKHTKNAFLAPVPTRWNSLYDSLESLQTRRQKLAIFNVDIFNELKLPELRENEFLLLEEYKACMKPLAIALDRLQGEDNTFQGEIIPLLISTKKKLEKLTNDHRLTYCEPLINVMLASLSRRFPSFMNLSEDAHDSIIASVSHPLFKMRWVPALPADKKLEIKNLFLRAAEKICVQVNSCNAPTPKTSQNDDIFEFEPEDMSNLESEAGTNENKTQLECLQYLDDRSTELKMLTDYPTVKQLFIKYNTPLPSSAPVERLFSFAGMILQPKRRRLSDDNFEKLLLLQANVNVL
jgi:hypothetical protein